MPDIFVNTKKNKPENTDKPISEAQPEEDKKVKNFLSQENHVHSLSSFCQNPRGLSFKTQEEDEQIILFLRPHFITNVPWIFVGSILLILPIFLFAYFSFSSFPAFLPQSYYLILTVFYYLGIFSYIFVNFITWFYNIGIVTTKRVVDIDYSDIVYHDVSMTKLNLIEDVNYVQTGFIRSLFNYGDTFIQTAGEAKNFDFLSIPDPQKATGIVEDLIGGPR